MNQLDLARWPCITLNGIAYNLPMPTMSGKAVCCSLGARNECAACVAKREAADKKLRENMLEMRGLPTRCNTRPELKAWEL